MDDTGARYRRANGVCTQIGNDDFAWIATTAGKSRLNFLDLLRAGHTDYVINDAALAYMREHALARPVIRQLVAHPLRQFAGQTACQRHLAQLGISAQQVTPDPVHIASECALWGAVSAHGFLRKAVMVSDDAGQFDIGQHALCWVHAERLVHKRDTFTGARCQHLETRGHAPTDRRSGRRRGREPRGAAGRTADGGLDQRDDTGARHRGAIWVCTQIGNDDFAWSARAFARRSAPRAARAD